MEQFNFQLNLNLFNSFNLNPFNLIKNFKIRYKLLFIYSATFIVIMALSSLTLYSIVKSTVEKNIESELTNSTNAILNNVRTAVSVSIKNHIRAAAEKNYEIIEYLYNLQQKGAISLEEAKNRASDIILCQKIGITGYLCILDGKGRVLKHPKKTLEGLDISDHQFVKQMITAKTGYIEYYWKNPDDKFPMAKALYINYFKPWDWLITVSSYREEFETLVNINDFRESILSQRFGKTGYSYVMDMKGNVIIHPELEGINVFSDERFSSSFYKQMLAKKNGKLIYSWKNLNDDYYRKKLVIFNVIPEYGWIVASASYLDEFYSPLNSIKNIVIVMGFASLIIFIPITFLLSSSITKPLQQLMNSFSKEINDGFSDRFVSMQSQDEVGQLAFYYNTFMEKLESYNNDVKFLEKSIMETGERERQKIGNDLHDDLCPHLIGIEGLTKVLKRKVQSCSPDAAILSDKITELIKEAISKTRCLARGLCPAYFNYGIISSLQELAANTKLIHQIECKFECREADDKNNLIDIHNHIVVVNIYHIAGEAVQNAIRHGKADLINIKLDIIKDEKILILCINDNGIGMDSSMESMEQRGMGIRIMTYRAKLIGAALSISSLKNKGTTVLLKLPRNVFL